MADFQILPRIDGGAILFEDNDIVVSTFTGGSDLYDISGTAFFAVASGKPIVNGILLRPGMYGAVPRYATFESDGPCRMMVAEHKHWRGPFSIGGPIEEQGRLRYINGCTDSGLIGPPKQGDPCLNGLFFPAGTLQTPHTHPSHRVGLIFDGEGYCLTEGRETPMRQGDMFIIPAHALHWFMTHNQAMRIIVFHPDSDFGPTDELHQMLEATIIEEPTAKAQVWR